MSGWAKMSEVRWAKIAKMLRVVVSTFHQSRRGEYFGRYESIRVGNKCKIECEAGDFLRVLARTE